MNYTLYLAELRLMLVALTMIKLLFFVRIFEEYGFLVSMIQYCIIDLIPFLVTYMLFLTIFAMLYTVLRMEPDPETAGIQNTPDFVIILLVAFRNAIGEVGLPTYSEVAGKDDSIFKSINILLIWATWYFQTFFLLVIMLNFLIAVIQSNYNKVINFQEMISYQHKAELNEECYQLYSYFRTLESFKIIVFSTSKEASTLENDEIAEVFDIIKTEVSKELKIIKQNMEQLSKNVKRLITNQDKINGKFHKKCEDLLTEQQEIYNEIQNFGSVVPSRMSSSVSHHK